MKRKFYYKGNFHDPSKTTVPPDGCATITFINKGTATVIVDSLPIETNDSFTDEAFGDEENVSNYQITFTGRGTQLLYVRRKYYK